MIKYRIFVQEYVEKGATRHLKVIKEKMIYLNGWKLSCQVCFGSQGTTN